MDAIEVPVCPKCAGGGKVTLLAIDASTVFRPLPKGWEQTVYVFQCECGWTVPTENPHGSPVTASQSPGTAKDE